MTDQLESFLRSAFEQKLTERDPDAAQRLLSFDYKPQKPRRRFVLPAVGGVTLAGAASAVALLISFGADASPGFARWTAQPTQAAPSQTVKAIAQCRDDEGLSGKPTLVDSRGPFTAAIWNTGTSRGLVSCISAPSLQGDGGTSAPGAARVAANDVQLSTSALRFASSTGAALGQATILYGRAGKNVSAVSVHLSNGEVVTATVDHGFYLAWWPGKATARTATITSNDGRKIVKVPKVPGFTGTGSSSPATAKVGAASSKPSATFAAWTAKPSAVSSTLSATGSTPRHADTAAAIKECQETEGVTGGPVLVDTRGPFTAALWNNAGEAGEESCLQGPSLGGGGGESQPDAMNLDASDIQQSSTTITFSDPGVPSTQATMLYGQAGTDVDTVTVTLDNGLAVSATVQHGFYLAWWPGTTAASTVAIGTSSGTNTVKASQTEGFNGG